MSYFNEYNTTYQIIDQIKILEVKGQACSNLQPYSRHLIYNRLRTKINFSARTIMVIQRKNLTGGKFESDQK
jgi:uncharacterized protein YcgI (DUF1989 family)